jgi:hypothetical protein
MPGGVIVDPPRVGTEVPATVTTPSRAAAWYRPGGPLRAFLGELLLVGLLLCVYQLVRHLAGGHPQVATRHADLVWTVERALWLPDEAQVQRWGLQWPHAARLANLYYVAMHFPGTGLAMVWLWWRHRAGYLRMRTELVLLTATGLVLHVLFPLAPPRLVSSFGVVDTMLSVGPSAYPPGTGGFANQFAAMPSLHVGWAVLVAVAVIRMGRSRWRWLVLLHPALTTFVVVLTANHYWLDGLVATALLGLAVLAVGRCERVARRPGGGAARTRAALSPAALSPPR